MGSRSRLYEGRFCAGTTVEVWGLIGEGTTRVAPTERRGMGTGGWVEASKISCGALG